MQKRPKKIKEGWWGFDIGSIDTKVRPQDDFYHYANGNWIKKNKIPPEESRWGSFTILRYQTEHQLKALVSELLKKKKYKKGSDEQLVSDAYRSAFDIKRRAKLGTKPLEPMRRAVRELTTKEQVLKLLARHHVLGISGLFGAFVDQDSKNSERYQLQLWQGGTSLPDRDYYLLDKPEQKRIRDAYVLYIETLLKLFGYSPAKAAEARKIILDIETKLAEASMRKEDTRDPEKIYHKLSIKELIRLSPAINWREYFILTDAKNLTEVNVGQPDFFKVVSKLFDTVPLGDWKVYLEWHLLRSTSSLLSEKFVKANFNFYGRILAGNKKMKPLWRRALGAANGTVGESLGKLYVRKYFPSSAKRAMNTLVEDLFVVYRERIKRLDWMGAATKRKALQKLSAMKHKIGYPQKWEGYRGLVISPDDYFGNMMRVDEFEHRRAMRKLHRQKVDRAEWFMDPQTVNAYFSPNMNDIVFPAAILQWPFFDPRADDAVNYAAIGAVIGHEMTHGFDDQGSKFDGKGNMKSWWTLVDRKRFEKKSKLLVEQYNRYEVAKGVHINGQLTLGENIADLGGLAIGWDAYQKHLKKTGRKVIAGLSPEERFFLGFAQFERELAREEFRKMAALTDPHAAAYTRVNGPLSNFEPFYKIFNVRKGNKLYRTPKSRAQIW